MHGLGSLGHLESHFTYTVFLIVKIDKDKRLVVLDEELEVCSMC